MTRLLAHRGPDGEGFYEGKELGLGHRRLAILDLTENGKQPMSYAEGRFWIVFNGEIYNFIELRDELEQHGHRFRSETDTEVILAAYAEWGEQSLLRFNGMWAFAIWDSAERSLFLARDRFGVKPLYYTFDGERFAFASEMKAFLGLKGFRFETDPEVVATALGDTNAVESGERCLWRNIRRLTSGSCLRVQFKGEPKAHKWWNTLDHLEKPPHDFESQTERFRELFFDACRLRMRSDVPIGTSLSGGIDSSSVHCALPSVRAAQQYNPRLARDWQRAFVSFAPDTEYDERVYAEEAARHSGATLRYCEVNPSAVVEHLDQLIFDYEEISDFHIGPWMTYRAMRRDGVVVSLDGHGGDELLAGYVQYPRYAMQDALLPVPRLCRLRDLQRTLKGLYGNRCPVPSRYGLSAAARSCLRSFVPLRRAAQAVKRTRATDNVAGNSDWLRIPVLPSNAFDDFERQDAPAHFDHLTRKLYHDFHRTTLPTILRTFDRCSMAHGVEIRAPFLDWRLVCFAFSLPSEAKLGGGFTKRILREAMRGVIPESIRLRTDKLGFGNPHVQWLRNPKVQDYLLDQVNSRSFQQSEIWRGKRIAKLVTESLRANDLSNVPEVWHYVIASRLIEQYTRTSSQ
jgi:asparagine synthase (glutamine-hydrolysing)